MTLTVPEFWTRDAELRRAHRIDIYAKATLIQRDLRSGSWLIEGIPSDHPAAADLEAGGGIIAYHSRQVLDSGRVEAVDEVEQYDNEADQFVTRKTAGGSLDLAYVEDRVGHPSPFDLDFAAAETKLYAGAGETALKAVVDDNLGATAHPSRRQALFAVAADLARGDAVRDEVRLDPLGELLAGWSTTAGVIPTCKVIDGVLTFDVYVPEDLTAEVVFSIRRSTASRLARASRAPKNNATWVGGQGEGTARTFVFGGDSDSMLAWGFRREVLVDRRDTNDAVTLGQARDESLATGAATVAVEADPLTLPDLVYLEDYRLGDLVTAVTAGGLVVARQIREVRIDCTPGDIVRFSPLLGDPLVIPPGSMDLFGQVRDLRSRIVNQEAR